MEIENIFDENGSRKVRESSEMSEESKRKAKKRGFVKKILDKAAGILSSLNTSTVIEITSDMSEFDSVIEELKNPYFEDSHRKKLIETAKEMIENSRLSYEQILNDYDLTEEQIRELKEKQSTFISEMQKRLESVEKRAEVEKMIEKPVVLKKETITTREELLEELKKLNPDANIQMVGEITPYFTCLVPETELSLPDGFYFDEKLGITNKDNVEGEDYISVRIINLLQKVDLSIDNGADLPVTEEHSFDESHEEPEMEDYTDIERESTDEAQSEEPIEEDDVELTDLTKFDTYSDYLIQYRKKYVPASDYDQFMDSVIKMFFEGSEIANVLSREKFIDEKRKQLERLEQRKIEEKRRKIESQLIDTENQLATASEKVEMLKRQATEYRERLGKMRDDNNTLEQKVFEQKTNNLELTESNKNLVNQVKVRDDSITAQQKQIFELRRLLEVERAARKEDGLKINSLEIQLKESRQSDEAKSQEIRRLNENTKKWRKNLSAELNKLSPEDDLEKTAQEWTEKRDDFFKKRENPEEKKGKHFSDASVTGDESEIDKLKEGMKKLTDLINNDGIDESSEKHHNR